MPDLPPDSIHIAESAGGHRARTHLRRECYPFDYWLYNHRHEPLPDGKAEFYYWKAHVWRGYHILVEQYKTAWANVSERFAYAIAGLSYDLAVLQANYVIDQGLCEDEAMRVFRDEAAELLEEITSSWRANCQRLDITFDEDDIQESKALAQPFHWVRDDLRRLLAEFPTPASPATSSKPRPNRSSGKDTVPGVTTTDNVGADRRAVLGPILQQKGYSRSKWAAAAGVDPSVVYDYLKGISNPNPESRKALAEAIGLSVDALPR
jgi:hypothetical protein